MELSHDLIGRAGGHLQFVVVLSHRRRPAPQLGVERLNLIDRRVRPLGDPAKVDGAPKRDLVESQRGTGLEVEAVLRGIAGDHDRRENHRHVLARFARQDPRFFRELPEIGDAGLPHRSLQPAGAAVVRRQRQIPVALEQLVERRQVLRGGERRFFGIGALVDVPIVAEPVLRRRSLHELPDALRFHARERVRLEGAFDQRHVRQVERQPLGAQNVLNHRQILTAAAHAFFDVVMKPTLEQLHIRKNTLIEGDGDVVSSRRQVRLHRLFHFGGRRRSAEGG